MKFVSYQEWSSRQRGATPSNHPIGSTKGIVAHWEGPHMGPFPHHKCADRIRSIQAFHRDTRGWADIAYNALVCPHGYVFEGRGLWTKSAANGDTQQNDDYYAVCYLGGERDLFTDEAKQGFLDAFDWLTEKGGAGPARLGHKDVRPEPTACPGPVIYAWVHNLKNEEDDDMADPKDVWKVKLPNKDAEGKKQGEMEAGNFLTNLEWNIDRDMKEVKKRLDGIEDMLKALLAKQ